MRAGPGRMPRTAPEAVARLARRRFRPPLARRAAGERGIAGAGKGMRRHLKVMNIAEVHTFASSIWRAMR